MNMAMFDCCDCRTGKSNIKGGLGNIVGASGEKLCGVGITFVEGTNGALFVKNLVPHGSAAKSQQILVGDVLFEVNGNNVYCSNPEQIGNLLLGVEGSQVELSFKRGATDVHRTILYRTSVASSPAAQAKVGSFQSHSVLGPS
mmetsp:Transcript_33687/g.79745  ORF Transcript_33687/g.79745 Transcript_33687/m.79745 type:complete len:143 (-) Transcript_33687:108-536(-)|eukprot:CAMPEP_0180134118 /NCGR_PEP_ID=MMETSP0986-20121125/9956_1 /TAXON_ID=697907 /ORGANISM="non described non described, Strain CCMP2293" /LENGTH=142 /DNA_ID=CAMNT_0022074387 /DNA_START=190 /DNA_END=618 /DNA_ORIENTATION=+